MTSSNRALMKILGYRKKCFSKAGMFLLRRDHHLKKTALHVKYGLTLYTKVLVIRVS